jgi:ABC-type uncharacterized transport system ATPase component
MEEKEILPLKMQIEQTELRILILLEASMEADPRKSKEILRLYDKYVEENHIRINSEGLWEMFRPNQKY